MTSPRTLQWPELSQWRQWQYGDYVAYCLGAEAMRRRLLGEQSPAALLSADERQEFCRPIRDVVIRKFGRGSSGFPSGMKTGSHS